MAPFAIRLQVAVAEPVQPAPRERKTRKRKTRKRPAAADGNARAEVRKRPAAADGDARAEVRKRPAAAGGDAAGEDAPLRKRPLRKPETRDVVAPPAMDPKAAAGLSMRRNYEGFRIAWAPQKDEQSCFRMALASFCGATFLKAVLLFFACRDMALESFFEATYLKAVLIFCSPRIGLRGYLPEGRLDLFARRDMA